MNARHIAEQIHRSREQAVETQDAISAADLASVAEMLGVGFHEICVSPAGGECIRISIPVTIPIRKTPMGERV